MVGVWPSAEAGLPTGRSASPAARRVRVVADVADVADGGVRGAEVANVLGAVMRQCR